MINVLRLGLNLNKKLLKMYFIKNEYHVTRNIIQNFLRKLFIYIGYFNVIDTRGAYIEMFLLTLEIDDITYF